MAANCPDLSKRTLIEAIFCLRGQKTHLDHSPPRLGVGTPDLDSTPLTVMLELMCRLQDKIMPRNYNTIKNTSIFRGFFFRSALLSHIPLKPTLWLYFTNLQEDLFHILSLISPWHGLSQHQWRVNSWFSRLMELFCYDTTVHNKSYAGPLLFHAELLKTVWLMS